MSALDRRDRLAHTLSMATAESRNDSERRERAKREGERPNVAERLRRLKALHRHGALSDAELLEAQKKLLGGE